MYKGINKKLLITVSSDERFVMHILILDEIQFVMHILILDEIRFVMHIFFLDEIRFVMHILILDENWEGTVFGMIIDILFYIRWLMAQVFGEFWSYTQNSKIDFDIEIWFQENFYMGYLWQTQVIGD